MWEIGGGDGGGFEVLTPEERAGGDDQGEGEEEWPAAVGF
jgi:hypothetical protein